MSIYNMLLKNIKRTWRNFSIKNSEDYRKAFEEKAKNRFKSLSKRKFILFNNECKIETSKYVVKQDEQAYDVWFFSTHMMFKVGYIIINERIKILFYNNKLNDYDILEIFMLNDDFKSVSKYLNTAKRIVRQNTDELNKFCSHCTGDIKGILELNKKDDKS